MFICKQPYIKLLKFGVGAPWGCGLIIFQQGVAFFLHKACDF